MRALPFMAVTALAGMTFGITIASTYDEIVGQAYAKEVISRDSNVVEHLDPENIQATEDVLHSLYEAQISLHNEHQAQSREHIEAALRELDKVADSELTTGEPDSIFKQPNYLGRKAVLVEFGSHFVPEQAILPLEEHEGGRIDVATIHNALDIEGIEVGKILGAEIRYVSLDLDKENTRRQLEDALAELEEKNFNKAQNYIEPIFNNLLEHEGVEVSSRTRARDHIVLTRYMVQQAEYDAARHTLEIAEKAVSELEHKVENVASLESIHSQLQTLEQTIAKRDPSMAEKIDTQLEEWLKALS